MCAYSPASTYNPHTCAIAYHIKFHCKQELCKTTSYLYEKKYLKILVQPLLYEMPYLGRGDSL